MSGGTRELEAPKVLAAVIAIGTAWPFMFNLLPVVLGTTADVYGFRDSAIGWLSAAYMGGVAAVTVSSFFWMRRLNCRITVGLAPC